ncbi:MAG TPA: glycosyl hydrolase [Solirubrobacteraceae bacterium]
MITLTRRFLAPLAALLCLLATAGSAGAGPGRAQISAAAPLGGVNVGSGSSAAQADGDIAQARALHARLVRTEAVWSLIEPNGPGQIDPGGLVFLDRLVSDASAAHIGVIVVAYGTPCWASSAPASLIGKCRAGGQSKANSWPPSEPARFAAFVAYLTQRYGSSLTAIEVWNEPDQANQDYFAGPDKPRRYAAILRSAYPAIKQVDPAVDVLGGSLVGSGGSFLRALYAAGIKGYYDGLAVHFYTLVLGSLRSIHETQLANGDHTPLWLDEFGWSSCYPHRRVEQEQACVTPKVQAANLASTFRLLARTPFVAAEVPYELKSSVSEDFGVLAQSGARKPAFGALQRALTSPLAGGAAVTLHLRARGGRVLAGGSGPVGDYMRLEVFQGQVLRYKALFTLNRFDRYSILLPRALGTRGLRARVQQYWSGAGASASL